MREASAHHVEVPTTDPTMIGVVVGLALMSVTLCVVLRLFAKARFRENRTIFNTPNPRLMNVSLLKGSKTLLRGNSAGGQRSRRGSQVSMASAQGEGHSPTNTMPDGNGMSAAAGHHILIVSNRHGLCQQTRPIWKELLRLQGPYLLSTNQSSAKIL
ncbi:hypothetical protein Ocin01_04452 [Orchesella cincta]|uniref:Uncharacterized protein n=1 Tax=Orchesella cincta TaxID=48709 RepID=A0A1D2NAC3_ORCCI|nr:hypothetical protein Ocin01_04452 [Orchesella cincta]